MKKFKDFFDFCKRVDTGLINKKKLESLILSGAFDFTQQTRSTLLQALEDVLVFKSERKKYEKKLETFHKKTEAYLERLEAIERDEKGTNGNKLRPFKKPEEPLAPGQPSYAHEEEMSQQLLLQKERELTGFFISGHPLDGFGSRIKTTIRSLRVNKPEQIDFVCIISDTTIKESKKKQRYAFIRFEDLTGTIEGVIWPWLYKKNKHNILPNIPVRVAAKVTYTEAEPDEDSVEDEVIPYLDIKHIELLEKPAQESMNIRMDVPLTMKNISSVKKILEKNAGQSGVASVRFSSNSGSTLGVPKVYGINKNGRTIRTEVLRVTKQ